jgi:dihydropyrimidinase/allantoinase
VSAAASLWTIAQAKEAGLSVTAETCPHYLVLTTDTLEQWGAFAKCNPPLRSLETQQKLWEAVRSGIIDMIGSDHAPYLMAERTAFADDIFDAPAGIPGLEEGLPLMLTAVSRGQVSLPQVVGLMSENPARLFKLWPRKGTLSVGADADVVIVDLNAERIHDHHTLYTKARDTTLIYDGMHMHGLPVTTLVRGKIVMHKGEVVGTPGWGQWVKPH